MYYFLFLSYYVVVILCFWVLVFLWLSFLALSSRVRSFRFLSISVLCGMFFKFKIFFGVSVEVRKSGLCLCLCFFDLLWVVVLNL